MHNVIEWEKVDEQSRRVKGFEGSREELSDCDRRWALEIDEPASVTHRQKQ